MSQKETTDVIDNLPKLAELARQAYEQKRTKDCLDLTRSILLIDPENAAALAMRSSIQSEMHRDLESARAFIRQAQSKDTADPESEPVPAVAPATPPNRSSRKRWFMHASVLVVLGL